MGESLLIETRPRRNQSLGPARIPPQLSPVVLLAALLLFAAASSSYGQQNAEIQDLEYGIRQLFLGDAIVASTKSVTKVQGQVVKHPDNPIIRRDKPWDEGRTDLYGSAVYDPEHQRIQLFYSANNVFNGHEDRLAYAESQDDGLTWTKPEFDLIPFGKHSKTNLVMLPPALVFAGPCVFRDEHEPAPAKRYKMFTSSYPDTAYLGIPRIYEHRGAFLHGIKDPKLPAGCRRPGMYVAYSPDGIHWNEPAMWFSDMLSDTTQSAFWDKRLGRYVAYVRARTSNDRSVARMESRDFESWSEPTIVLEGTPSNSLYSMGVTPYQGLYIGTLWIFAPQSESKGGPVIWPELAVSRDGIQWDRPFQGKMFIPTGPAGSGDFRQIRMSASLVVRDDKIVLLYGQTDRPHRTVDMRVEIGMAHLRLDGFAAMTAGEQPGSILTKPLRIGSGRLYVNADISPGGYLKAEILDQNGKPRPGLELSASTSLTGNTLRSPMVWKEITEIAHESNDAVQIRFVLKDAKLYSFWMQPL
jgi:hypothetical protein